MTCSVIMPDKLILIPFSLHDEFHWVSIYCVRVGSHLQQSRFVFIQYKTFGRASSFMSTIYFSIYSFYTFSFTNISIRLRTSFIVPTSRSVQHFNTIFWTFPIIWLILIPNVKVWKNAAIENPSPCSIIDGPQTDPHILCVRTLKIFYMYVIGQPNIVGRERERHAG